MKDKLIYIFAGVLFISIIFIFWIFTNTRVLNLNGDEAKVLVANNPIERMLGLSGRSENLPADGMLFIYPKSAERTFWMKGMKFDLDIVWIKDGKIMSLEEDIPAPINGEEPRKMYSGPLGADMILEMPSGGIDQYGLLIGQQIIND